MPLTMSTLLMHDERVPIEARHALIAAHAAPPAERAELLESAARILYDDTELDCEDVLELVDLPADCGCGH